jgi:hypothetical protein
MRIIYREDISIIRAFGGIMAMKRFAVAEWLHVKKGDYEGHIPGAWKVPQIELEALGLEPILRSEALRLRKDLLQMLHQGTRIKNAVIIYGESPPDCAPSYDDKIAPLLKELTRTAYNKGWSDSRRRRKKRG